MMCQVYNNSAISLVQPFLCVCMNSCIRDSQVHSGCAAVHAYTNKSLNLSDNPLIINTYIMYTVVYGNGTCMTYMYM